MDRALVMCCALLCAGCPDPFPAFAPTGAPIADAAPETADIAPPDQGSSLPDIGPPPDRGPVDAAPDVAPMIPDGGPVDLAPPDAAPAERCDGLDDDGDGAIDEDADCGAYIERHCQVGIGWAAGFTEPLGRQAGLDNCTLDGGFDLPPILRCAMTAGDGRFRALMPHAPIQPLDFVQLGFTCFDEDDDAGLAWWLEGACAVYLGHALVDPGDGQPRWGTCPELTGTDGERWCLSSGGEGWMVDARTPEGFSGGTTLAIGFTCVDADQPARALAASASASVTLGWSTECPPDGSPSWDGCPATDRDAEGPTRCAATAGQRLARTVNLTGTVGADGCLGIALTAADR